MLYQQALRRHDVFEVVVRELHAQPVTWPRRLARADGVGSDDVIFASVECAARAQQGVQIWTRHISVSPTDSVAQSSMQQQHGVCDFSGSVLPGCAPGSVVQTQLG